MRSASWSITNPRHRFRNSAPGRIRLNSFSPKNALLDGRPSTCRRDDVGDLEQLVEADAAARVAERQLVGGVVEDHPHAECLGHDRQLGADVAVADDAERAAADLMRAAGGLVPHAGVHRPSFSVSRRVSAMISARVSSTTLRVFEYGALNTAMPSADAAARSIWSVPMQNAPTASRSGAAARAASVSWVLDRMPSTRHPAAPRRDQPRPALTRSSVTSQPGLFEQPGASGWMFSSSSAFTGPRLIQCR